MSAPSGPGGYRRDREDRDDQVKQKLVRLLRRRGAVIAGHGDLDTGRDQPSPELVHLVLDCPRNAPDE